MKKLLIIFLVILVMGCYRQKSVTATKQLSDSSIMMLDEFHTVIYNTVTGKDEIIGVSHDIPDGTKMITSSGDTLYWLGGDTTGVGKYISSKEWKIKCKEMEDLYKKYR
ncbi:MAG: hypothetical protein J5957_09000 [Prevotella sp.]|nr:hypothetical protein [Prevotella sp.]